MKPIHAFFFGAFLMLVIAAGVPTIYNGTHLGNGNGLTFGNLSASNNVNAGNAVLTPNGDGWFNNGSAAFGNGNFNINPDGSVVDTIGGNANYEFVVDGQGNLRADSLSVNSGAGSISAGGLIIGTLSPTNLLSGGAAPAQVLTWNGTTWLPMTPSPGTLTNLPSYVVTNNQTTPTMFSNSIAVAGNITGYGTISGQIATTNLLSGGATNSQVLTFNGVNWVGSNAPAVGTSTNAIAITNGTGTNTTLGGVHVTSGLLDGSTGSLVISNPVVVGIWPTANLPLTSSNYSGASPTNTFSTNITTGVTIDTSTGRIWWYYNSTWN